MSIPLTYHSTVQAEEVYIQQLVHDLGSEFVPFDQKTAILKELRRHDRRKARDQAMRDFGLIKVKGALGGTYWE